MESTPLAGPVIATHLDATMVEQLRGHPSRPTVIALPAERPKWKPPPETEVLFTNSIGWRGAPASRPADWPRGLRWIQTESVGVDTFPPWLLDGPVVTCAKGSNAPAIAEYVMTTIQMHEKRLDQIAVRSRADWRQVEMGSVEGRTLGIAGFGFIGAAIAKLAKPFGMRVIAARRGRWDEDGGGVEPVGGLAELFAQSDHLVLAMPATPETRGIVGRDLLCRARPGLHLINVARGSLIDQEALLDALDEGRVAAASLDVSSPEPLPEGHRLYAHPRVRLTPHVAWKGSGNKARFMEIVMRNLDAFVAGQPLTHVVDRDKGY